MKRASSELTRLIKDLGMESSMALARLKSGWGAIFRGPLSEHSMPLALSGGRLLVAVDSPAWVQQLNFLKGEMLIRLRGFGVEDIGFKLGRVSKKPVRSAEAPRAVTGAERAFVEDVVSGVRDAELREQIRRAVEKSLSCPVLRRRRLGTP